MEKFSDNEIQKPKFHLHKEHISIRIIDIDKTVVSSKVSFGKKDLNILLATKMLKKIDLCVYVYQK